MRPIRTLGLAAAGLISLAACGSDPQPVAQTTATVPATSGAATTAPTTAAPTTAAPATAAPQSTPASTIGVKAGTSALGPVLVGPDNGRTMYGFTNDVAASSTCTGTCAELWPPVIVSPDWTVGPGLDSAIFATTTRDDGSLQLVAGRWPLYFYEGDAVPGDVTGQGSGGVWFAVGLDGRLIDAAAAPATVPTSPTTVPASTVASTVYDEPAAAANVGLGQTALGEVLVDAHGNTLYAFTKDEDGTPTCAGDCAATWPPYLVAGDVVAGDGLDPSVFTTVATDGGEQLKAGKWPLYTFLGDSNPGDANGQGSGGVWFVVRADGTLIKD